MSDENYILLSMKDDKAKKLSKALSNDTAQKILEFLSKVTDSTETDISHKLGLPISTVHYNLMNLHKSKIVDVDEFHYSEKGKEVNHYKLANKLIIIMPSDSFKDKLKTMIPVSLSILGVALIIHLFSNKAVSTIQMKTLDAQIETFAAAPRMMAQAPINEPNIALWFLIGSAVSILIYLLVEYTKGKLNK
jgi:predicted ArsR family transcriptional regulator